MNCNSTEEELIKLNTLSKKYLGMPIGLLKYRIEEINHRLSAIENFNSQAAPIMAAGFAKLEAISFELNNNDLLTDKDVNNRIALLLDKNNINISNEGTPSMRCIN